MLDQLALPFDPSCLEFHKNDRAVRTPSAEQVRRPINREGVDVWRNYEPWLGDLKIVARPGAQLLGRLTQPLFDERGEADRPASPQSPDQNQLTGRAPLWRRRRWRWRRRRPGRSPSPGSPIRPDTSASPVAAEAVAVAEAVVAAAEVAARSCRSGSPGCCANGSSCSQRSYRHCHP